jgi:hypothetical protein
VTSATHLSEYERYRWLNDSLSVGVRQVRAPLEGESPELIVKWSELVWEPLFTHSAKFTSGILREEERR